MTRTRATSILFSFLAVLLLSVTSLSAPTGTPKAELMGFKVWKKKRVISARNALDNYKVERLKGKVDATQAEQKGVQQVPVVTPKTGEALRQLEFNLEIALGLTIHDYFALYLKDKTKPQITEVIKQLSAEELSELLMAYRKQLYGIPGSADGKMSKNIQ